jgi:hypothetical protein
MASLIDIEGTGDGYSGTFRWKKTKKIASVKDIGGVLKSIEANDSGWIGYFKSRYESPADCARLIKFAQSDMCLIDCLSFSLSIVFALKRISMYEHLKEKRISNLHIVCIGCSAKAEERVATESDSFDELFYSFKDLLSSGALHLYLVGPEMSATYDKTLQVHIAKQTAKDFFRSNPSLLSQPCVVVGFNCGFGNWVSIL